MRMELLNGREAALEKRVICRLEEYDLDLRKQHLRDSQARFDRNRALFQEEIDRREKQVKEIGKQLERAFAFAQECFGDGAGDDPSGSGLPETEMPGLYFGAWLRPLPAVQQPSDRYKTERGTAEGLQELREERRGADAPEKTDKKWKQEKTYLHMLIKKACRYVYG